MISLKKDIQMIGKTMRWMMAGAMCLAISCSAWAETGFHNGLSFQGYTGLFNAPNAAVTAEGRLYFLFSDQVEPHRRHLQDSAENYMFSIGLLPYFEIGGRFTEEHPDGMRDLSANAKVQVPRFFDNPYIPDLAFGIQDLGGGSAHLETKYGVVSETIGPVRLSLGLGIGPDRLDGLFGGGEVRLFDWLYLLGEYDTEEVNVGFRVFTPDDLFPIPVNIGLTAKTSLEHDAGEFDLAATVQFPLGLGKYERERLPEELGPSAGVTGGGIEAGSPDIVSGDVDGTDDSADLEDPVADVPDMAESVDEPIRRIKEALVDLGFENVKAGVLGTDGLFVAYENNRYNHNALDGLGLVMGVAARMAPVSLRQMTVVLKRNRIPMISMSVPVDACRKFLTPVKVSLRQKETFLNTISISNDATADEDVRFVGDRKNSSLFRPRLALYPGLRTFLGTEISTFDYLVSLRPDLKLPVWPGGVFNARWDIPIFWSEEFDDGEAYAGQREDARLDRFMYHQTFKLLPDVATQFSLGRYTEDNFGLFSETFWSPGEGRHRLGVKLGYFRDEDLSLDREIYLATYRFYWERLDLFLEGTYGRYWYQDQGVTAEVKRYFGDTAISFFYRHIGTGTGERAGGIRVTLPLTPRKEMKPWHVQVTGSDSWRYEHSTTVADEGQRNPVVTNLAVIPKTTHDLAEAYFNDDRLNERYIRAHSMRLREAYQKWGITEDQSGHVAQGQERSTKKNAPVEGSNITVDSDS